MGKCFRLFTAGWEWDGNVGSHLVNGTGRDYTISWRDGIGERIGNIVGKSVGNIVINLGLEFRRNYCGNGCSLPSGEQAELGNLAEPSILYKDRAAPPIGGPALDDSGVKTVQWRERERHDSYQEVEVYIYTCLLYTSPSPRDS